jgi:hypothetical protein
MDKEKAYLKDAILSRPRTYIKSFEYRILTIEKSFSSIDVLYDKIQAKCEADATFRTDYFKIINTLDRLIIERDIAKMEDEEDWEPGNECADWVIEDELKNLNLFLQLNPDLYNAAFRNKNKGRKSGVK